MTGEILRKEGAEKKWNGNGGEKPLPLSGADISRFYEFFIGLNLSFFVCCLFLWSCTLKENVVGRCLTKRTIV